MNTEKMDRIIEKLGEAVYTEQDVIDEFSGKSVDEIEEALNESYPVPDASEDNGPLAEDIYDVLK